MRNRLYYLLPVIDHLGALFWMLGFLLLVPLVVMVIYARMGWHEVSPFCFVGPALGSMALGLALRGRGAGRPLDERGAMLVCALAWVLVSAVSALPFCLGSGLSFLDAYFETVSGYTTTGLTMYIGLDNMPRSILFWRAFIQWLGGIGMLAFLLVVLSVGKGSYKLFSAEGHDVSSGRPAPGIFRTLKIIWAIYSGYTALIAALLLVAGCSVFDAITNSFTALATGGFCAHDASIGYYSQAGHAHYRAIEYVLILGMVFGATSFMLPSRLLRGEIRCLWDTLEVRLWWLILVAFSAFVFFDQGCRHGFGNLEEDIRTSAFNTVSIATTTGFTTQDLSSGYYSQFAKGLLLALMVIGGCVFSTAGGVKVPRIGILLKVLGREIAHAAGAASAVNVVVVDGEKVEETEIRRTAALFFGWLLLLFAGTAITTLLSNVGALESASGMATSMGNVGGCFIAQNELMHLHPLVKITYIFGMLAGRLELVPILMLFHRRTWV